MSYKGFTIITASTLPPWGAIEQQNWQDMADTVCIGTITGAKDVANGHQHGNINNSHNKTVLSVDSTDGIQVMGAISNNGGRIDLVNGLSDEAYTKNGYIQANSTGVKIVVNGGTLDMSGGDMSMNAGVSGTTNIRGANVYLTAQSTGSLQLVDGLGHITLITGNLSLLTNTSHSITIDSPKVILPSLPTSSSGLASGTLYRNGSSTTILCVV